MIYEFGFVVGFRVDVNPELQYHRCTNIHIRSHTILVDIHIYVNMEPNMSVFIMIRSLNYPSHHSHHNHQALGPPPHTPSLYVRAFIVKANKIVTY